MRRRWEIVGTGKKGWLWLGGDVVMMAAAISEIDDAGIAGLSDGKGGAT